MTSPSTTKSNGGAAGPYTMGGQPAGSPSLMYGGVSSSQRAPAAAPPGMGAMSGGGMDSSAGMPMGSGGGSMYGMGGSGGMGLPSGYGNMYGQGGSMYGVGSMYGMNAAGGAPPPMGGVGSMYGPGSMYGMGDRPVNTGHYSGSLYGGSLFGISGNLYSEGGSLYGSGSGRDIMGSMQGFGSMYEVRPHTELGSVQKIDIPWYSIVYGSMGTVASEQNLSANPSFRGSMYDRRNSAGSIGSLVGGSAYNASNASGHPDSGSMRSTASGASAVASPKNRGAAGEDKDGRSSTTPSSKTRDAKFTATENVKGDTDSKTKSRSLPQPASRATTHVDELTEAPKSPHSTRTISGRGLVVANDHKIQVVGVIEKSTKAMVRVKATGNDEKTLTVDGKNFPLAECVPYDPAKDPSVDSQRLSEVIDHLVAGHNTALFIADDTQATKSSRAFTESAVKFLLEKLQNDGKRGGTKFVMHFSACATRDASASKDLLDKTATYVPMDIGASPLFGTIVMNLKSREIKAVGDFTSAVSELYDNLKESDKTVFGWLVLRVVKPSSTQKSPDVFLSSMQVVVSRNGAEPFLDAVNKKEDKVPVDLFRYSLGGPGVTVAAVCVLDSNSASSELVESMKQLGDVSNSPPRSGNVRRFVEFTEKQYAKLKTRRDEAPAAERADLNANCDRLEEILDNAKKVVANPLTAEPGVYRSMRRSDVSPSKENARSAAAASPSNAGTRSRAIDSLITPGGTTAASPSGQPRDANTVRAIAVVDGNEGRNYTVSDKDVIASAVNYTMDDIVARKDIKPSNFNSNVMTGIISTFVKGSNAAILSTDSAALVKNPFDAPAWAAVVQAVRGCVTRSGAKTNMLRASIALVRSSGEAIDLVKGGSWKRLVVASSPLFGPVVHNATLSQIATEDDFTKLVSQAKSHLGSLWGTDTAVYCTLVSCFSSSSDTYVSSLMAAFCGTNTAILNDAMQRRGEVADIFRYAFGGTAQSVYVVTLGKDDPTTDVAAALNSQRTAKYVKNRQVRRGSVADFVKYTEGALEKRKRIIAETKDPAEKEASERVIAPMTSMLVDHREVLSNPAKYFPRAYAPDHGNTGNDQIMPEDTQEAQAPTTGFVESQVVAFVSRAATQADRFVTVGAKEYAVDEVVQRITDSSGTMTKPSLRMAELEKWFTAVHNCSLVSVSTVASETLKEEPVWMYLRQIVLSTLAKGKREEQVEMEFTFAMVSASELLGDLLAKAVSPSSKAMPLEVASSPLFGPRVQGVTVSKAVRAAEVETIIDTALDNAMKFKSQLRNGSAMISCTVVQRRKSGKDVLVSSLSACHIQGPSVDAYKTVIEQLDQRSTLLGCSFGGPCSTIALLNYDKEEDVRNKSMTETMIALAKKSRNLASRTGSVASFIRYTQTARDQDAAALKNNTSIPADRADRIRRKVARLDAMISDHQRVLDDYTAPIPTYLNVSAANNNAAAATKAPAQDKRPSGGPSMQSAELSPGTVAKSRRAVPSSPATSAKPSGAPSATSPTAAKSPSTAAVPRAPARSPKTNSPQTAARSTESPATYPVHEGDSAVKTLAVVTAGRASPGASKVKAAAADDTHLRVTLGGAPKSFLFDEVTQRTDNAATIRSNVVNELIGTALAGFNVGLLCTDQGNGSASVSMATRVVRTLFSRLPTGSEVWLSLTAHRDGMWKDMQNIGSSFRDLSLASSPLFGPCPFGSWLLQLRDAQNFETLITAATSEFIPAKAMCVACLVVKQIKDKDVCLSSALITISGDGGSEYERAAATGDKHQRGMFQYALSTACFTVCAFACPESVEEEGLDRALNFHESIRGKSIGKLRNGSVKQFYKYMSAQCKKTESNLGKAADDRQREKMKNQIAKFKTMIDDCESMLSSPAGLAPPVYEV